MFPTDALTITHEQVGAGSYTFFSSGVHTVLGLYMAQSGTASDTFLNCGSAIIAKNYAKELAFVNLHYYCNGSLSIVKTGNDSSFISLTYVSRDMNLVPYTASESGSINDVFGIAWLLAGILVFTIGAWIGSQALRR